MSCAACLRLALYLVITANVTGCDGSAGSAGTPRRPVRGTLIAFVGPPADAPESHAVMGGGRRYFEGLTAIQGDFACPREAGTAELSRAVGAVLEHRPAALCLYVTDPEVAAEAIDRVIRANVFLVTMGTPPQDDRIYAHVEVALTDGAELLADNLEAVAAGGKSYVLVHQRDRSPRDTRIHQRFVNAARRQYGLSMLKALPDPGGAATEVTPAVMVEELLNLFPHTSLVVTLTPEPWLVDRAGWERRLRQLNDGFRFATLSAVPKLWERLGTPDEPGTAAALVGPLDGEIGHRAVELAVEALYAEQRHSTRAARIPCELVTPATLPDFAQRYSAAAGGLDVSEFLPKPEEDVPAPPLPG